MIGNQLDICICIIAIPQIFHKNVTFSNISVIVVVSYIGGGHQFPGVPGENHRPAASH